MESIVKTDIPALGFLLMRSGELLHRTKEEDIEMGKRMLLTTAHRADLICEKLTALVELEARGRKDLE